MKDNNPTPLDGEEKEPTIYIEASMTLWKLGWPELTEENLNEVGEAVAKALEELGYNSEGAWSLHTTRQPPESAWRQTLNG